MILLLILKALVLAMAIALSASLACRATYRVRIDMGHFVLVGATWALFYFFNALSQVG